LNPLAVRNFKQNLLVIKRTSRKISFRILKKMTKSIIYLNLIELKNPTHAHGHTHRVTTKCSFFTGPYEPSNKLGQTSKTEVGINKA
jgi:hypothetical protein